MPKIVTANQNAATQKGLEIDRDGNRTLTDARRNIGQYMTSDVSGSGKESMAPVQNKPAFNKPLNVLA